MTRDDKSPPEDEEVPPRLSMVLLILFPFVLALLVFFVGWWIRG